MISFTWQLTVNGSNPADVGRDLLLNATGDDLFFENGELSMVKGAAAVASDLKSRLQTFAGEFFLDTSLGMPWLSATEGYPAILGSKFNAVRTTQLMRETVLSTPGVVAIDSLAVTFSNRVLSVRLQAIADDNAVIAASMQAAAGGN